MLYSDALAALSAEASVLVTFRVGSRSGAPSRDEDFYHFMNDVGVPVSESEFSDRWALTS